MVTSANPSRWSVCSPFSRIRICCAPLPRISPSPGRTMFTFATTFLSIADLGTTILFRVGCACLGRPCTVAGYQCTGVVAVRRLEELAEMGGIGESPPGGHGGARTSAAGQLSPAALKAATADQGRDGKRLILEQLVQ